MTDKTKTEKRKYVRQKKGYGMNEYHKEAAKLLLDGGMTAYAIHRVFNISRAWTFKLCADIKSESDSTNEEA